MEQPILRIQKSLFIFFLLFFPLITHAGWTVVKPQGAIPNEPFFQAKTKATPGPGFNAYGATPFPNQTPNLGQPLAVYAVSLSGSLKENVERIMERYRWRVIWKAPYDYNFDGRVTGSSLPNVVEKLMRPFPLRAVMYTENKTMIVVARNNK